ncbi:MAG TPA: hypothetical protein VGN63_12710 [Flavisolibacter sp.]|jgi:hypothetical protein|nr:hypothetical protein [Flavisolibacter sp.]
MTIINFVQNNHNHRQANPPVAALEHQRYFRLLGGWVDLLSRFNRESGEELRRLQQGLSPEEREKSLTQLARLQEESTTGLQRLTALLKDEDKTGSTGRPPLPPARSWVWLSFQYFFESFNPEMAAFQLWTLVRPVLTAGEGPTEKEREEAASFYELGKLLMEAAWEMQEARRQEAGGDW